MMCSPLGGRESEIASAVPQSALSRLSASLPGVDGVFVHITNRDIFVSMVMKQSDEDGSTGSQSRPAADSNVVSHPQDREATPDIGQENEKKLSSWSSGMIIGPQKAVALCAHLYHYPVFFRFCTFGIVGVGFCQKLRATAQAKPKKPKRAKAQS